MSSDHYKESAPGPHGAQDDVDYGKVIGVGVVSLLLFAVSIWWASIIWRDSRSQIEAKSGKAAEIDMSRTEIGIVDQVPFVSDKRLPQWKAARKHELECYGWVDKSKSLVRIPIEAAMAKVAAGTMPEGAPK
jgi:hypothetical protein